MHFGWYLVFGQKALASDWWWSSHFPDYCLLLAITNSFVYLNLYMYLYIYLHFIRKEIIGFWLPTVEVFSLSCLVFITRPSPTGSPPLIPFNCTQCTLLHTLAHFFILLHKFPRFYTSDLLIHIHIMCVWNVPRGIGTVFSLACCTQCTLLQFFLDLFTRTFKG